MYRTLSIEAIKMLFPLISSFNCGVCFSAMIAMKSQLRSRLQVLNSYRFKLTNINKLISM